MNDNFLGIKLIRTANAIRRMTFNDSLRSGGNDKPTGTQEMFLAYMSMIGSDNDILQKDLESWFNIRRSTATEILKRMELKGLIKRVSVEYDKRAKKILLTDKAKQICNENWDRIMTTEAKLTRGLTDEEIGSFFYILSKIQRNIE